MSGAWDAVAGLLGFGGPSGNDHGSSNWAAWGHREIRSMLDHSVDPGDIGDAAQAWRDQSRGDAAIVTGLTRDLQQTVSGGWRGASADAALAPLGAINQWSTGHTDIADHTSQLMADSGSSVAQAKASVPPPRSHNWRESLLSFAAQSDAHAEAVRIMTNVYSAPINDNRAAVPTYAQLADPTQQPPEAMPTDGSVAAPGYSGGGAPGPSAGPSAIGHRAHTLAAPTALQTVSSADSPAAVAPAAAVRGPQHGGGQVAAAPAAAAVGSVPIVAPIAEDGARRVRAGASRARPGGGRSVGGQVPSVRPVAGAVRASAGHEFGPRPSAAAAETEGRMGAGMSRGVGAATAGRAGPGEMMAPMGAAGGKGGEDSEHRRPSYLIEMDDIFTDGRKVAPAVIGEDPAGQGGS
ncbi:MAG: hypothetical protein AUG49_10200 [Catenulispora sp. 13_1_20CM_3_70_7]|nr:MAG: hypothetical protein AUG49_10200 [Catenulispora sp. 13_1_20CM_3_70_7]